MIKRYMWSFAEKFGQGLFVSDKGDYVKYEDYAELQQKLDAMAAENAAMQDVLIAVRDQWFKPTGGASYEWQIESQTLSEAINQELETPATDTYLNSVRADAVEDAVKQLYGQGYTFEVLTKFAAQLRYGTHDTADKAG